MKKQEVQTDQEIDTTLDAGRRSAMRKLAVGVGVLAGISVLPERWTRPIIGEIVLPAHAQTSGLANGFFSSAITVTLKNSPNGKVLDSLAGAADSVLDFLVADAHAGFNPPEYICVNLVGDSATVILGTNDSGWLYYQGVGTYSGGVVVTYGGDPYNVTFISRSSSLVTLSVVRGPGGFSENIQLTPGSSCPAVSV
jgi:hypothetical protein